MQDFSFAELQDMCLSMGEKQFRAKQLYEGLMQGKSISQISTLSKAFRERLLDRFEDEPVRIRERYFSGDGTEKYLFGLADGNLIEGVVMRYKYGNTQCVSTQVGCRMGCKFCASTLGGRVRDLTSGEILCQILTVNAVLSAENVQERKGTREITNVVLMGSGEPLDNYANTVKFLRNVTAEGGINISARNISLSTCGLVDRMNDLAEEGLPVNLTVSLHATDDGERARIMPIARSYSIREILDACDRYFRKTGRRYYFEYTLIEGENCDDAHADALSALLRGKPCHVNLIRLNAVKERSLSPTDKKQAYRFLGRLEKNGISATLRRQIGSDIGGACGQLRAGYLDKGSGAAAELTATDKTE